MAKKKKDYPGTIYSPKQSSKLYIAYKGKRIATGLPDTARNREVCKIALRKLHAEYLQREYTALPAIYNAGKVTFASKFEEYLQLRQNQREKNTLISDVTAFKAVFGDGTEYINDTNVQIALKTLAKNTTFAETTYNLYLIKAQTFLRYLHEEKYITELPNITRYKRKEKIKKVQTYTAEEIQKLTDYLDVNNKELKHLILLMLHTGMRINEVLSMTMSAIDGNIYTVPNKINRTPEKVYLSSVALAIIQEQCSITQHNVLLFSYADRHYRRLFIEAMKICGIEANNRSFHEFRKTFREQLIQSGIAPEHAMLLMRHKEFNTTMKHYTTSQDKKLLEILDTISQKLD